MKQGKLKKVLMYRLSVINARMDTIRDECDDVATKCVYDTLLDELMTLNEIITICVERNRF